MTHLWQPTILSPFIPAKLVADEYGPLHPERAEVGWFPKCRRCGCHVAPGKKLLYRQKWASEWREEEPPCIAESRESGATEEGRRMK